MALSDQPSESHVPMQFAGEGPLVPLLRPGEDPADELTRATWHEALSVSLASEVPHELFGFWLYPAAGGSVLLGPEALAADQLAVPEPPSVGREQLTLLEDIVRDAGYRSTTCVVASDDGLDVGLLMFAALAAGAHGPRERAAAQLAADALAPTLGRLARRWRANEAPRRERTPRETLELIVDVTELVSDAATPKDLSTRLSATLARAIAHERLEIVVPGTSNEQWYRLGEHPGGPLWGDPDLVVPRAQVDLAGLFASDATILFEGVPGDPVAFPPVAGSPAMRSVAGVRLELGGRLTGALLIGSSDEYRYSDEDLALIARIAPAVATRVDALVAAGHLQVLRAHVSAQRSGPSRLARMLEVLATVKDPAEALRRVRSEAAGVLEFDEMTVALRLGDESRVAMLRPGERRPLADLPQIAPGESPLGRILRGESATLIADEDGSTSLLAAVRFQGRVTGALVFSVAQEGMFGGGDDDWARQCADLLAPWLEVLRREAIAPPVVPGWKRSPRFGGDR
jgi:GAF domain-containing protein